MAMAKQMFVGAKGGSQWGKIIQTLREKFKNLDTQILYLLENGAPFPGIKIDSEMLKYLEGIKSKGSLNFRVFERENGSWFASETFSSHVPVSGIVIPEGTQPSATAH